MDPLVATALATLVVPITLGLFVWWLNRRDDRAAERRRRQS